MTKIFECLTATGLLVPHKARDLVELALEAFERSEVPIAGSGCTNVEQPRHLAVAHLFKMPQRDDLTIDGAPESPSTAASNSEASNRVAS